MTIHELLRPEKRRWRLIRETQDFKTVREGYNARAETIDSNDAPNSYHLEIAENIERFGVPKSASILDAGCGAGGLCKALLGRGYTQLSAFDISDTHVADVGKFVTHAWQGIGESINQANHSYDVVISSLVIEHCMSPLLCLAEMYRVLKPGGLLYITTDNAWWCSLMELRNKLNPLSRRSARFVQPIDGDFTLGEFQSMLTGCGFKVEKTFFLGGFPWGESVLQKILRKPTAEIPGFRYFATRFGFIARRQALPVDGES